MGYLFLTVGLCLLAVTLFQALGWANLRAGVWVRERRHHPRVVIVLCLDLLWTPVGTILGAYGLYTVSPTEVKARFR